MIRLLLVTLTLAAAACAGAEPNPSSTGAGDAAALEEAAAAQGIYPERRATRIALVDHKSGTKVGLLNESHTSKAEYYSVSRGNADYKVIPDLDMGALVKQLDEFGFFAGALRSSARVPGARTTVQIERDGEFYTLAYSSGDPAERHEQVLKCAEAVRYMYNAHQAYQIVENNAGAEYFVETQRQLQGGGN